MIVVDTSVWLSALGDTTSPAREPLVRLLDGDQVWLALPVRLALLGRLGQQRPALAHALHGLPLLTPGGRTWKMLETVALAAADAGQRLDTADLLTVALADENGARLWTFTPGLARLGQLGLVRLYDGLARSSWPPPV